jgi:two-component system response regulator MprA
VAKATILVVEDDAIQREGLRTVLERQGYFVTLTVSPAEALARLSEGLAPDLILLAMLFPRVPDSDGWVFLRERQHRPDIAAVPVLLTTVVGKGAAWAASLGAQGYLRKPMDVEPLLTEVGRLLIARSEAPCRP